VVLLQTGPLFQAQQVSGGTGTSQASFSLEFGLGAATNVDLIRIFWPSGIVQRLENVKANQILKVSEAP
jgi:hypothetical protein